MIQTNEEDLICDFAETYRILDYKELSPKMAATLLFGLKDCSRVKMKITNTKVDLNQVLLAMIVDNLSFLCWAKTKDGQKGKNRPKRVLDMLLGKEEKPKDELLTFNSPEEYMEYLQKKKGVKNG